MKPFNTKITGAALATVTILVGCPPIIEGMGNTAGLETGGTSSTGTTGSTGSSGTTSPITSTTEATTGTTTNLTTGSSSSTTEAETGNDPVCGNGIVEEGEYCDDQNDNAEDGCSNTCECTPALVQIEITFADIGDQWLSNSCCNQPNYRVADDQNGPKNTITVEWEDSLPPNAIISSAEVWTGIKHASNPGDTLLMWRLNETKICTWGDQDGAPMSCGYDPIKAVCQGQEAYQPGEINTLSLIHEAPGKCREGISSVPDRPEGVAFYISVETSCQ